MPNQNDPWVEFRGGAQAAPQPTQPSQYPGVIQGRPSAPNPIEAENLRIRQEGNERANAGEIRARRDQDLQEQTSLLQNQLAELTIAERTGKQQATELEQAELQDAATKGIDDSKFQIRNVIRAAKEAKDKSNDWFATGFGADTMKGWGGSSASDVAGLLNTIGANTAFDRLTQMREESKTGGGLGQVSEIELQLLRDSIASIGQSQSDGQFQSNMQQVIDSYQRVLDRLEGREPTMTSVDRKKAAQFWNSAGPNVTLEIAKRWYAENNIPEASDEDLSTAVSSAQAGANFNPNIPSGSDGGSSGSSFFSGSYSPKAIGAALAEGTGSMVEGIASIPGMAIDPIGQMLYSAMGNDEQYNTGQIVRRATGLPENKNQTSDTIIQAASGGLTGAGVGRSLTKLATSPLARNVLNTVGKTPLRDTVAGAGAGAGIVLGEASDVPGGALAGALLGGLLGYGSANALANVGKPRTANALGAAAEDLSIDLMPASAGGPATRMATGGVGATFGGIPIAEGAQKSIQSAGKATRRIANEIGDVTDQTGAGQEVARGFGAFKESSAARGRQLYDAVSVAGDAKVVLDKTRSALLDITEGFSSNPELSRLWSSHPRLRATLESLVPKDTMKRDVRGGMEITKRIVPEGGELSWIDMNRFRSIVGEVVGQPGVAADGSDIAGLRKLYGALSADMEATATAAGPKALQEFRRANQYWRGRQARIDDVFSTLLGPKGARSPEKVFKQINSWAKGDGGDFRSLARTIRSMPDDEAGTIRATIVERMGKARPAHQLGEGEVFSPKEFASQWHAMSSRAKSVLFPNKAHRANLDKLSKVMDGMKNADQYANYSRSALGVNTAAQGGLAIANLPVAASLALSQLGAGKLLASPRFARWLATSPKSESPEVVRKWTENLGVIAAREPVIAKEIQSFQQHLLKAANDNPASHAAAED